MPASIPDQETKEANQADEKVQELEEVAQAARDAMDQIPGSSSAKLRLTGASTGVVRGTGGSHPACNGNGCHAEQPFECLQGLLARACSPVAFATANDCEAYCYHSEFSGSAGEQQAALIADAVVDREAAEKQAAKDAKQAIERAETERAGEEPKPSFRDFVSGLHTEGTQEQKELRRLQTELQHQQQAVAPVPQPQQDAKEDVHRARTRQQQQQELQGFRGVVASLHAEGEQGQQQERKEMQRLQKQEQAVAAPLLHVAMAAQEQMKALLKPSPAPKPSRLGGEKQMNVSMMASLINSDTNLTEAKTMHEQALDKLKQTKVTLDAALQRMHDARSKQAYAEVAAAHAGQVFAKAKDELQTAGQPTSSPLQALLAGPTHRVTRAPPPRKWEPI